MAAYVRKYASPGEAPKESRLTTDLIWLREDGPLPPCTRFSGSQFPELRSPRWSVDQIYLRKLYPHPA